MTVRVNPIPSSVPDALDVDETYLRRKIAERSRVRAKPFLMDQAIIRGIGNAYADEILWQARISPKSTVGRIPDHVIDDFLMSIRSVLTEAIEEIKRQSPEAISGEVRDFLRVHNSKRSAEKPDGPPNHEGEKGIADHVLHTGASLYRLRCLTKDGSRSVRLVGDNHRSG